MNASGVDTLWQRILDAAEVRCCQRSQEHPLHRGKYDKVKVARTMASVFSFAICATLMRLISKRSNMHSLASDEESKRNNSRDLYAVRVPASEICGVSGPATAAS